MSEGKKEAPFPYTFVGHPSIKEITTEPLTPEVGVPFKLTVEGYNFDEGVKLWVRFSRMGMLVPHPDFPVVTKKSHSRSIIEAEVRINHEPGDYVVEVGRKGYNEPEDSKSLKVYPRSRAKVEDKKRTMSVVDIVSDPRISKTTAWFSQVREKYGVPPGDTMKDHGEAWTDGEEIIQLLIPEIKAAEERRLQNLSKTHRPKRKK